MNFNGKTYPLANQMCKLVTWTHWGYDILIVCEWNLDNLLKSLGYNNAPQYLDTLDQTD